MSTDIRAAQKAVGRFMLAGGQIVNVIPTVTSQRQSARRVEMLIEEVRELEAALKSGDLVEVADAYADIIYVALGGSEESGIDIEPVIEEVIRSNNSKIDWKGNRPWVTHPNGKIAKDAHYSPPRIAQILECQESMEARL